MNRKFATALLLAMTSIPAFADEPADDENIADKVDEKADQKSPNGDGIESPRSMSGMSILGNEETPKSLVIIPWKSSEMGDELTLADTLDDRARPVDKEVFLRELEYYKIRSGE
jgi:hypothetical protein